MVQTVDGWCETQDPAVKPHSAAPAARRGPGGIGHTNASSPVIILQNQVVLVVYLGTLRMLTEVAMPPFTNVFLKMNFDFEISLPEDKHDGENHQR